jgi:hypothetical protein
MQERKNILIAALVLIVAVGGLILYAKFAGKPALQDLSQNERPPVVDPKKINFAEHIAPIIYQNCTPCHRKGEAAPFELMSYKDVLKRAKTIALVTRKRFMPPWPADPSYRHFANERVLSDYQVELIQQWVKNSSPLGDPLRVPSPPTFTYRSQLGKPDLVLTMPDSFKISGNNLDHFIVMKVPFELPEDKYVRVVEFVPGNRKLLHHVNGHLLSYDPAKKKNVFDGEKAVDQEKYDMAEVHQRLALANDDGTYPLLTTSVFNYLPGVKPAVYPNGIGGYQFTRKGAFYLKDIHYGPTPVDQYDRSSFNIYFMSGPPKRPVFEFQLGTLGVSKIEPALVIPPNEIKTFTTEYTLPATISVLTLNPHMHLLGKKFWAFALPPGGDTIPLIRINDWDFRWQYFYTFRTMLKLPKGTVIKVFGTFDNTTHNPRNPFNPPRTVSERNGSMRTSDEMFQLIINYVPYQAGDEQISLENTSVGQ